jgi:hypothetical protein
MADLSNDEFRTRLRAMVERSGRSMRALSAAFGRDPGYVAALLDPTRPSRARPTPADLVQAADVTGIPFVTWLEALWDIPPARLAAELAASGQAVPADPRMAALDPVQRRLVSELVDALSEGTGVRRPERGT